MAIKYIDMGLASGNDDGSDWANAYHTAATIETWVEGTMAAGDFVYVKPTTITLNASWGLGAIDGTATNPIYWVGVKEATTNEPPTFADWADGNLDGGADDRPTIACGSSYYIAFGDFYKVFNFNFTGSASLLVNTGTTCLFYNCSAYNSSETANRSAFSNTSYYNRFFLCQAQSTNGTAISCGSVKVFFCYILNSDKGIVVDGNNNVAIGTIFNNMTTAGIELAARTFNVIMNNTFYDCPIGISATSSSANICINNIIDTSVTDGFIWTTQTESDFFAYNHQGNTVTDMYDTIDETNPENKDNWMTGPSDPKFTTAGSDFSLASDSPCIDAGMAMTLGVG